MTTPQSSPLLAIVNTSVDLAQMLAEAAQEEGYRTVTAWVSEFRAGRQDLAAFLREHEPDAVIWDVAIPYAENWALLERVRTDAASRNRHFVVTTTNKQALEAFVSTTDAHEIVGKPYDLDELVAAVRGALGLAEQTARDQPPST